MFILGGILPRALLNVLFHVLSKIIQGKVAYLFEVVKGAQTWADKNQFKHKQLKDLKPYSYSQVCQADCGANIPGN